MRCQKRVVYIFLRSDLAGLEIFFDHIIGANATCYIYRKVCLFLCGRDDHFYHVDYAILFKNAVALFSDLIKNSVDTTVKLFVYNTRFKAFRGKRKPLNFTFFIPR